MDDSTQGSSLPFACTFSASINQFLCILDAGGEDETFFLIDRLSNGAAEGSFEFCDGVDSVSCTVNVTISPDGVADVVVQDPQAESSVANRASSGQTDLLPYLQYLKQGSVDAEVSIDSSSRRVDALFISVASDLKDALTNE